MSRSLAISLTIAGVAAALFVLFLWPIGLPERANGDAYVASEQPATLQQGFPPELLDPRPLLSRAEGTIELCGYGPVQLPEGEIYPADVQVAAHVAVQAMAKSAALESDDFRKAGGLYVWAVADASAVAEAHRKQHPGCDADCSRKAFQAWWRSTDSPIEQLAAHATASRNPGAYALAFYACQKMTDANAIGQCALITAQQWAQLDADNLVPWLFVAEHAARKKNETERIAALERALQAKSSTLYREAPLVLADQPALQTLSPATRMGVHLTLAGINAALPSPSLFQLVEYCRAKDADHGRLQQCSNVATILTQRGTNVLEMSLGAAIGSYSGWPKDRVEEVRDRVAAYQEALSLAYDRVGSRDFWSCDFGKRMEARSLALGRYGEVGAARRAVKATGKSEKELARDWGARMQAFSDKARAFSMPTN
jgi:hypothetical protein